MNVGLRRGLGLTRSPRTCRLAALSHRHARLRIPPSVHHARAPPVRVATEVVVPGDLLTQGAEPLSVPTPQAPGAQDQPAMDTRTKAQLWKAAIKPLMYSVGFMPVLVGMAATLCDYGAVSPVQCSGLVVASLCWVAWLNLSNDAYDADTGVDRTKPESVVNLTGSRIGVLLLSKMLLLAGFGLLAYLTAHTQDWRIGALVAGAMGCGYIYQGPPFRLGYLGLGEPLCFLAAGPLCTTGFYLALLPRGDALGLAGLGTAPRPTPLVAATAILMGVTTATILFTSHWHQIEGDRAGGKLSPLVRLGSTAKALPILNGAVLGTYTVTLVANLLGALPLPGVLATALSLPAARNLLQFASQNHADARRIAPLKIFATKWHIAYGFSLVLGLTMGHMLA